MAGVEHLFPNKDVIYTLVEPEYDEDGFTGVEKLLYIGTDYDRSRKIPAEGLENLSELRHRVYVDSELMFEARMAYGDIQWVSTYDLLDELEQRAETAKQELAKVTARLISLGQL